ncbi:LysR family transcriptional regulator [Vibrio sp.]|nr:LysR family transcriptional regulator [Vibrio sp.]
MVNFNHIDLNLLRTLNILLVEHSVSRTAEKLHLSQPSVSVHLSKLRHIFNDQLLIPESKGMRPTALAEQLRKPLADAMDVLGSAVNTGLIFDPASATNTWRLAAADYGEFAAVKAALNSLYDNAPHSQLSITHMIPSRISKQLERGEIDLAFHLRDEKLANLRSKTLFTERYKLVGRKGHPSLNHNLNLDTFCQLKYGLVSSDGGGFKGITDDILAQHNLSRQVVLSVPHFHFLMSAVTNSDIVALLPERLLIGQSNLTVIEPPIDIPGFELVMLWHERSHRDPAHQWLREQFVIANRSTAL